jgi:copper chaperone CopZ
MEKIKLKINDRSCQHCVKTGIDALTELEGIQRAEVNLRKGEAVVHFDPLRITAASLIKVVTKVGFEAVRETGPLSLVLIGGILITLLSIVGCSDVPYTGPMLTVDHVERFLDAAGESTVCLQDGFDSVCIKLVEDEREDEIEDGADDNAPVIHIHPTNITYIFHYEGQPILRAERTMDTTEIVQELMDAGKIQLPPNIEGLDHTSGNNSIVGYVPTGWVIQMYSPELSGGTSRTREIDIRVVEGTRITRNTQRDLELKNFRQASGSDGSRGVQFFIETEAPEITIQVERLVPDHIATFHISVDGVGSDGDTNTLELDPLR